MPSSGNWRGTLGLCVALLLLPSPALAGPPIESVIIAGQSNSETWWCLDCEKAGPVSNAWIMERNVPWHPLTGGWDTTANDAAQWPGGETIHRVERLQSPWVWLGHWYREHVSKRRRLHLFASGVGGTCLVGPGFGAPGEPRWDPDTGDLYAQMLDVVQGFPSKPRALIWIQGHCDVFSGEVTGSEYFEALMAFADRVEADLGVPILLVPVRPIVVAPGLWDWDLRPMRWAQFVAGALHPNITVVCDPWELGLTTWDGLHFREVEPFADCIGEAVWGDQKHHPRTRRMVR